jgi:hypothetical protein
MCGGVQDMNCLLEAAASVWLGVRRSDFILFVFLVGWFFK